MGKVCIVGCGALHIDYHAGHRHGQGQKVLKAGDSISIDGFTGEVFDGQVATRPSEIMQVLIDKTLQARAEPTRLPAVRPADELGRRTIASLEVRTNADEPDQAREAIAFGAEGIGLCRTEHMFFDHIDDFREMILATDARRPRRGAGQAAALPARGLRRPVPGDGGPAGHHPHCWIRRCTSSCRTAPTSRQNWRGQDRHSRPKRSPGASRSCTSSTPCSAFAAAGWASSIPRSRGCRPGPSSRPPAT